MLSFEDRFTNEAYRLTFNEEELVDYIKNHKQEVSQIKNNTLAEIMSIAPNTITRFVISFFITP
jgi:DNA-binding MurR/RpiR family transcriptional regulator